MTRSCGLRLGIHSGSGQNVKDNGRAPESRNEQKRAMHRDPRSRCPGLKYAASHGTQYAVPRAPSSPYDDAALAGIGHEERSVLGKHFVCSPLGMLVTQEEM